MITRPNTEVRRLIHIYPERINIETTGVVEEYGKLVSPESWSGFMKPIGVHSGTRPDNSLINRAVAIFEKYSKLCSSIVGIVVLDN